MSSSDTAPLLTPDIIQILSERAKSIIGDMACQSVAAAALTPVNSVDSLQLLLTNTLHLTLLEPAMIYVYHAYNLPLTVFRRGVGNDFIADDLKTSIAK